VPDASLCSCRDHARDHGYLEVVMSLHPGRAPRIRGRRLQQLRASLYGRQPFCAICGELLMPWRFIRDHIVPLAEGGQDTEANTQAICPDCSAAKSQAEAQRGQARTRRT
jgi:5-methylcytosine-specific restriction enzyme A